MGTMKMATKDLEIPICEADAMARPGNWYGIRTATRQEDEVETRLQAMSLEVWVPRATFWRRLRSNKSKVHRPLFPGYLFVRCTPDDFHRIHGVEGFHQFVRVRAMDGQLLVMRFPDEAIGDLMMRQFMEGEFDETRSKPEAYRPKVGDRVVVTGGKWYAYLAEVLSLSPSKRQAKVRIEDMAGAPASVSYSCLDAA
ncbi:MAG: transcription/translation regulatory transformer protein RfaH [Caulobacter sp.]|nr:transcription/translation regulatory transformer protein RfaH [Caulobacter sp.]